MFLMTKAFSGRMRKAGWGRVINMASDTVSLLVPALSHYIASKAGVIGVTRALATEFGEYGVTVNAVAPGLTQTQGTRVISQTNEALFELTLNMQSIKRGEQPSDLVGAVSFLASQDAGYPYNVMAVCGLGSSGPEMVPRPRGPSEPGKVPTR
jgi:(S)-1-phenylethanol dehydrogenase